MWSVPFEFHVVLGALLLDALVGDPPWLYRRVPHPVAVFGRLADRVDQLFAGVARPAASLLCGVLSVAALVGAAVAVALLVSELCARLSHGWLLEALVASTLIACRSLHEHVSAVARGLEQSLEAGRRAVSHVVGRDPQSLDEAGVARAAIESVAENFSDAVVVPLFWYALTGLPGLFAYKAINTLDSMFGHRTARYRYFGKPAARIDDVANYLPARLAGLYLVVAAFGLPGANGAAAFRQMLRYAPRHRSPNAGWPEAALAGALDFALAGPRTYPHEVIDDAWMGDGRAELSAADIHASLRLYRLAATLVALTLAALAWLW